MMFTQKIRNEGLHMWLNGETGMIISWTISTDGRVLRMTTSGYSGRRRLPGNSSIVLAVSWGTTQEQWSLFQSVCV